jgi:hypothetical protein
MKYVIFTSAKISEYENYFGEESFYSYNMKLNDFEVEFENVKELNKFINYLNGRNDGIFYSRGGNYDRNSDLVYLDEKSFINGYNEMIKSINSEKERIIKNRELRKEIKDLKLKKSKMNRGEIIKSKINSKILELKNSIQ